MSVLSRVHGNEFVSFQLQFIFGERRTHQQAVGYLAGHTLVSKAIHQSPRYLCLHCLDDLGYRNRIREWEPR